MFTALNTLPILSAKSRELRELFADTANDALSKGRSYDEAVFKGIAIVRTKEQATITKSARPPQPVHLRALLDIRKASQTDYNAHEELEKAIGTPTQQETSKELSAASFTDDGRLVLKFKDGSVIETNRAPIQAVETSVVVIGDNTVTSTTDEAMDGGSATSVFKPQELIDGGTASG